MGLGTRRDTIKKQTRHKTSTILREEIENKATNNHDVTDVRININTHPIESVTDVTDVRKLGNFKPINIY